MLSESKTSWVTISAWIIEIHSLLNTSEKWQILSASCSTINLLRKMTSDQVHCLCPNLQIDVIALLESLYVFNRRTSYSTLNEHSTLILKNDVFSFHMVNCPHNMEELISILTDYDIIIFTRKRGDFIPSNHTVSSSWGLPHNYWTERGHKTRRLCTCTIYHDEDYSL